MTNHRTSQSTWLLAISALLIAGVLNTTAASTATPTDATTVLAGSVPAARGGPIAGDTSEQAGRPLTGATGAVTAFVELTGTPAVDTFTAAQARGESRELASTAAKQARQLSDDAAEKVVAELRGKDAAAAVVGKTSNAVSGVVVTADAAKIRELTVLPEVKAVRPTVPKVVQNASSVQLTKALQVWQQTGRLGEGMRVGVVDTGIDYTHADFGGPGTVAAYQAIDRTTVDPAFFPTAKVVGGKDFSGDDYDARYPEKSTPKPDDNPLDCAGHGTHVAGTAAGYGENADGSPFTGDYGKLDAAALAGMRIGPGTAPKASLYALKVFGCQGSTNLTAQALDWSLDPNGDGDFSDHLDVVNLSLGSDYAAQDDPDSLFVRKITAAGVLVVAAAGNGGDFYDIGGSPANTPEALAVANTRDAFAIMDGVEAAGTTRPGQYSQNYTGYDTLDLTKDVVALTDTTNPDGCNPFSDADKALVAGKFAWLDWDDGPARRCGSGGRTDNARAAGAVGVVLPSEHDTFLAAIAGNTAIPVFQLTRTATTGVRAALDDGTLRVRMTGALRNKVPSTTPTLADTMTPSSSRGARGPVAAKPDVAAPGDTILSADFGTGNGVASKGGTSMATPHVAGIAALVRETHPDWSPEEVKAAVVNTATADVKSGDDNTGGLVEAPMRVGAGRVDARAAVETEVLAMVADAPGSVGVSFGPVEAAGPVSLTKTVKLVNKGTRAHIGQLSYQETTSVPGVVFDVSAPAVSLPARGTAQVEVTLRIANPAELRKVADPTVVKEQAGQVRQYLAEASGRLVLELDGGPASLRVPVYAAPKPAADLTTEVTGFRRDQGVLNVSGRGLAQGSAGLAYRSLLSVFELQGTSDQLPDCTAGKEAAEEEPAGNEADCAVNTTAKGGDLRYVGAASTAPSAKEQDPRSDALLAFGVVTWGNWVTLGRNNTPVISIDTTGDGEPDFTVSVAKPKDTDIWLARTRAADGAVVDERPVNGQYGDVDTNVMDTNVVVLPVALTALGIDPAKPSHRITYTVGTEGDYTAPGNADGLIDQITDPLSFDPLKPGLWTRGAGDPALSYAAEAGTALVVHRDRAALAEDRAGGLLVLQHHNTTGARAQVVEVTDRD